MTTATYRAPPHKSGSSRTALFVLSMIVVLTFIVTVLSAARLLSVYESATLSSQIHIHKTVITSTANSTETSTPTAPDNEAPLDRWVEAISWEPRAFVYHNFLTRQECEHLIELARPHMVKSTVVDVKTGRGVDSKVRTSSGTFLARGQDDVVRRIEKRIADFTFIPEEHGEGLQVLHYEVGQKYEPHHDYLSDEFNTRNGGRRIATFLMYLTDVEEGGETVFPFANGDDGGVEFDEMSECTRRGVSVKPKMGNALLFWSLNPDTSIDQYSLHGGCPVIRGNKWSSTKWLRLREYKI